MEFQFPLPWQKLSELLADSEDIVELFYRGEIARQLVDELKELGGILSYEDMSNYKSTWDSTVSVHLNSVNLTVHSVPPPGSGAVLAAILNILDEYNLHQDNVLFYHRIVEAFKFAYGQRSSLGDPKDEDLAEDINKIVKNITSDNWARSISALIDDDKTNPDIEFYGAKFTNNQDKGTAHLSVVDEDGNAVSATSTINQEFGSGLMSPSTGIIYNDEMDDFSYPGFANGFNLPPSPSNFVKPGKSPLSSMAPAIFIDQNKKVRLVTGGAGGSRITTGTAFSTALNLWLGYSLKDSVDSPRLHHQLSPNVLEYQSEFDKEILAGLIKKGHQVNDRGSAGSIVTPVQVEKDFLVGVADYRKAGDVDGY